MVNYYHRFIPQCTARLSPKSNFDLKWNESAESAFSESKQILANATLLVHPDPSAPLNITWDASDFAVGGVLQQYIDNVWQPLSFFSKKLNPAEKLYSTLELFRKYWPQSFNFCNVISYRTSMTATIKTVGFHSRVYYGYRIRERPDKFRRWRAVTTISVSHRQYISNQLQIIKRISSFRFGIHAITTFNFIYYELSTAQVIS